MFSSTWLYAKYAIQNISIIVNVTFYMDVLTASVLVSVHWGVIYIKYDIWNYYLI